MKRCQALVLHVFDYALNLVIQTVGSQRVRAEVANKEASSKGLPGGVQLG